ncbi:VOC family protein [Litorimonas sp.]|uniref:VOC family protein n=1 Tax=Litorimonas sp. TaxID=1892381 RepID=UPI003A8454CC
MQVKSLDHVNIISQDLHGTAKFYADLLQLEVRDGPPPMKHDHAQWLFDVRGRAVIHVNAVGAYQIFEKETSPGETTGALHHVAFDCDGYDDLLDRIISMGLEYKTNAVSSVGLRQVFVYDPNGVLLELNFRGD